VKVSYPIPLFFLETRHSSVMLDGHLGKISNDFHSNNKNNQLKRQVWPSRDVF